MITPSRGLYPVSLCFSRIHIRPPLSSSRRRSTRIQGVYLAEDPRDICNNIYIQRVHLRNENKGRLYDEYDRWVGRNGGTDA